MDTTVFSLSAQSVIVGAHLIGAVAYSAVVLIVLFGRSRRSMRQGVLRSLTLLSVLSAGWAGAVALATLMPSLPFLEPAVRMLDVSRTAAWALLIFAALDLIRVEGAQTWLRQPIAIGAAILTAIGIVDGALIDPPLAQLIGLPVMIDVHRFALLGLTLLGILLVENLFQHAQQRIGWTFKHLIIGSALWLAFELAYHVQALLLEDIGTVLDSARVLVGVIVLPMLLVSVARTRGAQFRVALSRDAMVHSTTLILTGLYLLAVGALGFYLQQSGELIGPVVQIVMVFGALMVLALVLLSPRVRTQLRRLITRNFFTFHYDYRVEWLRFIRRMTSREGYDAGLYGRAVRAFVDIFDCDRGALFLAQRGGTFSLVARLNLSSVTHMPNLPPALIERLAGEAAALELSDPPKGPIADWAAKLERPWLLIPLRHSASLVGALLLCDRRIERPLTWEDRDLMEILSIQTGSYIAEDLATRQLLEAQRFEQISKNFSFVAHDLKNLVSQLSLITQNAHKHGDNPEFQRDALETVTNSVEKMRSMLVRLKDQDHNGGPVEPVNLALLLREAADGMKSLMPHLRLTLPDEVINVPVDGLGLGSIVDNLLHNALEATGREGRFELGLARRGGEAVIRVSDDGPGMTEAFIAERLNRPFSRSQKSGGFGIGLFQTREFVERFGGRCVIDSTPGEGTTVQLFLPLAKNEELAAE